MTLLKLFDDAARMTDAEYRAMNNGINIVFGAVLGVVLTRTEDLSAIDFMLVLAVSAIAVSQIIALGIRERQWQYAVGAAAAVALLPLILQALGITPIPKLQPTLIVWAAMVFLVEFTPRKAALPDKHKETPE